MRSELGGEGGHVGIVGVWGGVGGRRGGAEGTALFTPRIALSSRSCSGPGRGLFEMFPSTGWSLGPLWGRCVDNCGEWCPGQKVVGMGI